MYPVSQKWNEITTSPEFWYETKVSVNGVEYTQDQIFDLSTDLRVFSKEEPTVGACLSGELSLKMLKPSVAIQRMAEIQPFVRACNGDAPENQSEWIPQGTYYIDTREESKNDDDLPVISFHSYDAMLKTEAAYPDTTGTWPRSDISVVNQIASTIGISVDARTTTLMNKDYQISAPIGYTMRETLSNIGAMYAGNWIITMEGKLLLVALNGIPEETSLLVTENGDIIMFGEDAISIVGASV